MLDPDIQRQLPALAERIRKNFDESDWIAVGAMTGCLDQIEGHHRLLRSLSFGDSDYRGHVIIALSHIIEDDPQNLRIISDYLAQQYPSTHEGINVSSRPVPGRAIYFTPSVFEVPEQGIDQTLVAVMMPFAAEYREVYETIQKAGASHGLSCNRIDDIWENAILIQDIFL